MAGGLSLWDMSLPPGQCTPNSTLNALHSTGGTNLLRGHLEGGPSDKTAGATTCCTRDLDQAGYLTDQAG